MRVMGVNVDANLAKRKDMVGVFLNRFSRNRDGY